MSLSNSELGKFLVSIRSSLNLSTYDVNKLSGISQSYLSLVENGRRKPSANILKKLSNVYHIDYLDLYKKAGYIDSAFSEKDTLKEKLIFLSNNMNQNELSNIVMIPIYENPLEKFNNNNNNISGYIPINPSMYNIDYPEEYFYYRLKDDSINRIIPSGSYILVRRQDTAINGDIVLFTLNTSSFLLKKYKKINSNIILLESISTDEHIESIPIYLDDSNLKIIGRVIAHIGII